MPTISQIRGMLLEEILLHLLRSTGYKTIESAGTDPTLHLGHSGLEVCGRGSWHQIDSVADFRLFPPFSHPQRLLVEAKCFVRTPVGLEIARNAVGVLKDVSEYWVTVAPNDIPTSRYHYQYALFSATPYTRPTQRYAFAQDIYLILLGNSQFFAPIIQAIHDIAPSDFNGSPRALRINLRGLIEGGFPVFLVPNDQFTVFNLGSVINVRIRWDENHWYVDDIDNRRLFSFDLPQQLFDLYASKGRMRPERALDLKEAYMNSFHAFLTIGDLLRVIEFRLDTEWIQAIREARVQR